MGNNLERTNERTNERNRTIDVLKGIAILFVVITHFKWTDNERQLLLFPFWINMAVPTFMFISGYVNTKSNERKEYTSFKKLYGINQIISKSIRLSVPFFIAYIIELIMYIIKDSEYSFYDYFMMFLNGGTGQGSYYYPVMMQFVFMFPVIYLLIKEYERKGLFLCFCINLLFEVLKNAYQLNEECYRLLVFRYIFIIAAGCYAAFDLKFKRLNSIIMSFAGAIYILLVSYTNYKPIIFIYWSNRTVLAFLFIVPWLIFVLQNIKQIRCEVLEILGKASYNILFVQMIFYMISSVIYSMIPSRIIQFIISIVFCCCFGVLFYLVETPFTTKLIRKIKFKEKLNE
jgi:peptidoglycan/LPS O-acetylase OafA/YrhL